MVQAVLIQPVVRCSPRYIEEILNMTSSFRLELAIDRVCGSRLFTRQFLKNLLDAAGTGLGAVYDTRDLVVRASCRWPSK
jgi:hypothetical protein